MYYYDILDDYSISFVGVIPPKGIKDCTTLTFKPTGRTSYYNKDGKLVYIKTSDKYLAGQHRQLKTFIVHKSESISCIVICTTLGIVIGICLCAMIMM